jgi:hypothetical protein
LTVATSCNCAKANFESLSTATKRYSLPSSKRGERPHLYL